MPKAKTVTPTQITASRIADYAWETIGENPIPLLLAIIDSISSDETCHLGRALLTRHDALADAPYRIGGDQCDPRLTDLATRLGVGRD